MNRLNRYLLLCWICLMTHHKSFSQQELFQLSGIVSDESSKFPISFVHIEIPGTYQWIYTGDNGFFSCVVGKEDTILFTATGYKSRMYIVPDSLDDNIFSIAVYLTPDTVHLGTVEIYPWPTREEFREAFLSYKEVTQYEIGPIPGIKRPDQIDTVPKPPVFYKNPISVLYEEVVVPLQWKKKKRDKAKELPKWE